MKKIYRWFGIFVLLICSMALFTGCAAASTIDTNITINDDLSGTRTMKVSLDSTILAEQFDGTIEDINALIEAECPQELTWNYESLNGIYEYTFELNFTSIDEYNQKVHMILTGEPPTGAEEAWVVVEAVKTIWKDSFYLEEDFTSEELFQWLIDALVEQEIVSKEDSVYVLSNGQSTVHYGGENYSTYEYAYVEEHEFLEYNRIELYTTINGEDNLDRMIVFAMPLESFNSRTSAIKTFMESLVSEGATFSWETIATGSGEVQFVVEKTGMTLEGLNEFTTHFFGSTECNFDISMDEAGETPFSLRRTCTETIDFSQFYDTEMEFSPVIHYSIDSKDGYTILGNNEKTDLSAESTIAKSKKFTSGFKREFYPEKVDVETKILGKNKFERSVRIRFDKVATELDLERINANIAALFGEDAEDYEKKFNIELTSEVTDDGFSFIIVQRGTEEQFQKSDIALFGVEGSMVYAVDYKPLRLRNQMGFVQGIELGRFISQKTEECVNTYQVIFRPGTKITYCDSENYEVSGRKLTEEDNEHYINMSVVGAQWNLWGICFWMILLAAISCGVLLLKKYGYLTKALQMLKERLKDIKEANNQSEEELKAEHPAGTLGGLSPTFVQPKKIEFAKNSEETIEETLETEQAEPWVAIIEESELEELDIEINVKEEE